MHLDRVQPGSSDLEREHRQTRLQRKKSMPGSDKSKKARCSTRKKWRFQGIGRPYSLCSALGMLITRAETSSVASSCWSEYMAMQGCSDNLLVPRYHQAVWRLTMLPSPVTPLPRRRPATGLHQRVTSIRERGCHPQLPLKLLGQIFVPRDF